MRGHWHGLKQKFVFTRWLRLETSRTSRPPIVPFVWCEDRISQYRIVVPRQDNSEPSHSVMFPRGTNTVLFGTSLNAMTDGPQIALAETKFQQGWGRLKASLKTICGGCSRGWSRQMVISLSPKRLMSRPGSTFDEFKTAGSSFSQGFFKGRGLALLTVEQATKTVCFRF